MKINQFKRKIVTKKRKLIRKFLVKRYKKINLRLKPVRFKNNKKEI